MLLSPSCPCLTTRSVGEKLSSQDRDLLRSHQNLVQQLTQVRKHLQGVWMHWPDMGQTYHNFAGAGVNSNY